jgi:AcrR family transcriptional regulator
MAPRKYDMGKRRQDADETRKRILVAARSLLTGSRWADFTVPAVARAADVARVTVYNQFGSKSGLLEALSDELARAGGMRELAEAFAQPEPGEALSLFITTFARFWASDRVFIRRLRAHGTLDPESAKVLRGRDERRRQGASVLLERLAARYGRPSPEERLDAIEVFVCLTSFETYDLLAVDGRGPEEVAALVDRLIRAYLGVP